MADVLANLTIRAQGADQAAAACQQAASGLGQITEQSSRMEGQFAHRFTHIGLQLFATDALRASGLGTEARQIIGTLQLAITSLGAAFGAAAGPIMLIGAALAAGIGIYERVHSKHAETMDDLKKLIDQEDKERGALDKSIDKLQSYKDALGFLPPQIEAVLQAKIRLKNFEDAEEIKTLEKQIKALQESIEKEKDQAMALEFDDAQNRKATASKIGHIAAAQGLYSAFIAAKNTTRDFSTEIEKNNQALAHNKEALAESQAKLDAAKAGIVDYTKPLEAMIAAKNSEVEARKANIERVTKEEIAIIKAAQTELQAQTDADQKRFESNANLHAEMVKSHTLASSKIESQESVHNVKMKNFASMRFDVEKQFIGQIIEAQGNAVAKMIVEGKSFTDSMKQAFKSMEEMFISLVEQMIVKWLAFQALTGGFGMGAGMAGGLLGMASGGSFVASSPTPLMVGEGGEPELVTVTPFSKMNSGSGSGGITIGTIQTNVYGVSNPDQIADQVGDKIIQRIRGRGELNFARSA